MPCAHHPHSATAGQCVDCSKAFCQECAIVIVGKGSICMDCGARFARKKLVQSYVAAGLGIAMGVAILSMMMSEQSPADPGIRVFGFLAPAIYGYLFWAVFFGWHFGGTIWPRLGRLMDSFEGFAGMVAAMLLLSVRLMVSIFIGAFGGGIVQFLRYRRILETHTALAGPSTP